MTRQEDQSRQIKSVDRACQILEALGTRDGATVSELSDDIDLSGSTIHSHLSTLKEHGFVSQDETLYGLGPKLLILGEHVRNTSLLYQAGKEEVDALAEETGECAHLVTEHNGLEVSIYESFGEDAVGKEFYIKNREDPNRHMESTAAGKAILAHLGEERVEEIVDEHGLVEKTENTITDVDELHSTIETIRERGYAVNDEEEIPGMRAVAAPIFDGGGTVIGAVSVSAPVSHMKGEQFTETIPESILDTKNVIEINLETVDYDVR